MKFIVLSALLLSTVAWAQSAKVAIELFPAGSFEAKGEVIGAFQKKKGLLIGKNIKVPVASLDTGIELRDKHLKKRLLPGKYPNIILLKAKAKGGKGIGIFSARGIKKKIKFNYKIKGSKAICDFKLALKDFNIKDINYMGVGVEDEISIVATVPIK